MTHPSKAKGGWWERECYQWARANGFPDAHRLAPAGIFDRGDIGGIGPLTMECKNERAMDLAGYIDEAERESANNGTRLFVAAIHRRGHGSVGQGYALTTIDNYWLVYHAAIEALDGKVTRLPGR